MELRFLPPTIGAGAGSAGAGSTTGGGGGGPGLGIGDGRQYHSHSPTPPPPTSGAAVNNIITDRHHQGGPMNNNCPTPDPTRRTLDRSRINNHHHHPHKNQTPPLPPTTNTVGGRRVRRSSGSGPAGNSPRIMRGPSTEYLQHGRSPMPVRAAMAGGGHHSNGASGGVSSGGTTTGGHKRGNRLGSRTENMSSGSLNSIEV